MAKIAYFVRFRDGSHTRKVNVVALSSDEARAYVLKKWPNAKHIVTTGSFPVYSTAKRFVD